MKKLLLPLLLLGFVTTAQAQVSFGIGGGPTFPTGDVTGDYDTGFHLRGNLNFSVPLLPVGVRVTGAYQSMGIDALIADASEQQYIGTLDAMLMTPSPLLKFYAVGGPSVHIVSFDTDLGDSDSETYAGFNIGVGVQGSLPFVPNAFAEIRFFQVFNDGDDRQYIPVTVGINF